MKFKSLRKELDKRNIDYTVSKAGGEQQIHIKLEAVGMIFAVIINNQELDGKEYDKNQKFVIKLLKDIDALVKKVKEELNVN